MKLLREDFKRKAKIHLCLKVNLRRTISYNKKMCLWESKALQTLKRRRGKLCRSIVVCLSLRIHSLVKRHSISKYSQILSPSRRLMSHQKEWA
jgi:hypothetical protein